MLRCGLSLTPCARPLVVRPSSSQAQIRSTASDARRGCRCGCGQRMVGLCCARSYASASEESISNVLAAREWAAWPCTCCARSCASAIDGGRRARDEGSVCGDVEPSPVATASGVSGPLHARQRYGRARVVQGRMRRRAIVSVDVYAGERGRGRVWLSFARG